MAAPGLACSRCLSTRRDRKSTRLNSSHANISYAVFCLKKKKNPERVGDRLGGRSQKLDRGCMVTASDAFGRIRRIFIVLLPFLLFFFNDTATTEIYTLSLHDALPILRPAPVATKAKGQVREGFRYVR